MEVIQKFLFWILLSCATEVLGGRIVLNGPSLQTSDLRAIDGYVASGLPLFANTHGFVLHSGMRPVIVKMKDPNKVIRDGIEQPNAGYYRDLPSVIPQGFEGISSTRFLLGNPIPPSRFFAPLAGPVVSFQPPIYKQQLPIAVQMRADLDNGQGPKAEQQRPGPGPAPIPEPLLQEAPQQIQQIAEPSIRVENTLNLRSQTEENDYKQRRNPVVVQTSEFESNLPTDYRNPFYSNEMLASTLAQESLPAPGEELVNEWNTNKIRDGRVRDLLSGAGLI